MRAYRLPSQALAGEGTAATVLVLRAIHNPECPIRLFASFLGAQHTVWGHDTKSWCIVPFYQSLLGVEIMELIIGIWHETRFSAPVSDSWEAAE